MNRLTHIDEHGRAAMVDTTEKSATPRRAIASARVLMSAETIAAIRNHQTPKGDPLETARLAGIVSAKRTADLIPLYHPLPLTHIDVRAEVRGDGVYLESEVATHAQTGVENAATSKQQPSSKNPRPVKPKHRPPSHLLRMVRRSFRDPTTPG